MRVKPSLAAIFAPLLLSGCAGANVGFRAGDPSLMRGGMPPTGTSYSYAAVQAEGSANTYFGMLFLGAAMFGLQEDSRHMSDGATRRKAPEMAEGRAIAERDCTKPLGPIESNLRCK